jgi:arginyl-tRNA--protein-N-Asp/Glu arginylyltransferase
MAYKANFRPIEGLIAGHWQSLDEKRLEADYP